ncbi:MAG: FAD-binding oxidoreductase [Candidatus Limnocylindrales bacterium]
MTNVIVIGGGIVGTAAAAFMAETGAKVTLFDRDGLASGASGANSGVIQHPMDPVLEPLYRETVALYRDLSELDVGFWFPGEPAGMLFLSHERATVHQIAKSFPDLATEILAGSDLQALEPTLAPDLVACRVPIAYPVPPSASTYAYATVAERQGVTVRLGRGAVPVVEGGRVMGVRVDGRLIPADQVLVAAGPWTAELIDPTGRWRPIRPLWGVVVETELAHPPSHVLEEAEIDAVIGSEPGGSETGGPETSDFSLVTAGGVSAVGSTFLDKEPDPVAWVVPLLIRASSFVPSLADASIRGVRACARPMSADGRPLIGLVPGIDGLYVCAGHGPWGISTGPASARLVVDQMLGRPVTVTPELDAARFGSPLGG